MKFMVLEHCLFAEDGDIFLAECDTREDAENLIHVLTKMDVDRGEYHCYGYYEG